jgi:hypothetical protein
VKLAQGKKTYLKKAGHYHAWFWNDVYRFNVRLIWEVSGEQWHNYLRDWYQIEDANKSSDFSAKHLALQNEASGAFDHLIALTKWNLKDPYCVSWLSHECLHAVTEVLLSRGLPLTEDTDEAFCYLHEWFMRNCLEILEQKTGVKDVKKQK